MINKKHRFYHRFSVQKIYKQAKTIRGNNISLKYIIKPGQPWRAAIVVSAKVSKSAVVRNRIRRRVFEWLRVNQELIPDGTQMIISVFDEAYAEIKPEELSKGLTALLLEAKQIS